MKKQNAFTLAEVLIALALLGVVAAFVITKVLQSSGDSHRKTVFREAFGEVSKVTRENFVLNTWPATPAEVDQYFQKKLNILSVNTPTLHPDGTTTYSYTLQNGAILYYRENAQKHPHFLIDYNGSTPPNQQLQDILSFWANMEQDDSFWCGMRTGGIGVPDPSICPSFAGASFTNQEFKDFFIKMVVEK